MIVPWGDRRPRLADDVWVQETAVVLGDVEIGARSSVWYQSVLRADVERIRIGEDTNLQDHCTVHVTSGTWPTLVGSGVTVGHRVVLHGCRIGDHCLIGIGAVVLDGVEIEDEVLVGAGSVVTPGTKVPSRTLVLGSPAKPVRDLRSEELEHLRASARNYVEYARLYRSRGL